MPDITCCIGTDCKTKRKCWRYLAGRDQSGRTHKWQSYFNKPPFKSSGCSFFMRPPTGISYAP